MRNKYVKGDKLSNDIFKPELFGKYILLERLAAGGMAEIYLAKHPGAENVSKFVAIKRILPQYSNNHEFIEMFKEEAKIAVNLSHSNVVQIMEFGIQNNLFFLTMQYVDGKNLRQILNRLKKEKRNLTIPQIVYLIRDAAKGLDHAHSCVDGTTGTPLNITHRDISPQNIMVSYEGEIRIIDFGIAKAESKIETTRAGTLKGKFGYMSPEQAEGYEVDFRTDIFSLGIVLWELLANDRLFVANSEMNILKKIRECHIPSLRKLDPNIPSELERITMKALARDRTLRYQSSEELAQDLQIFLNKHNPEFTARDLSSTLKEIFFEDREQTRQKLIEYSKLQIQHDDKTIVTNLTQTITETDSYLQTDSQSSNRNSDSLNLSPQQKIENFNLEFDKEDIVSGAIKRKKPTRNNTTHSGPHTQPTSTATNYPNYTTTMSVRKKPFPWGLTLTLIALIFGSFQIYNDPNLLKQILNQLSESQTSQSSVQPTSQDTAAETKPVVENLKPEAPFYNLLVTSTPSGSAIFIDGKSTGSYTPAQVRVPGNKGYVLRLDKDGYLSESKHMLTTQQGDEARIVLNKKESGYINVTVSGGNAAIYINGKKISERAPIKKYKVTANTTLRVQAFNPAENIFVEKSVTVESQKTQNVHLNLTDRRKPSNKK